MLQGIPITCIAHESVPRALPGGPFHKQVLRLSSPTCSVNPSPSVVGEQGAARKEAKGREARLAAQGRRNQPTSVYVFPTFNSQRGKRQNTFFFGDDVSSSLDLPRNTHSPAVEHGVLRVGGEGCRGEPGGGSGS